MSLTLMNARWPDGSTRSLPIADGKIADAIAPDAETIDLGGALVLPGLIDGHMHLDKTLLGGDWVPHRAGDHVADRIEWERHLRRETRLPVETRAAALVRQVVALGTATLRTHVDIDTEVKLSSLHAIFKVRERFKEMVDIQIVAFPQNGVIRDPGTADLLDAAVQEGAEFVGGVDPAGLDRDAKGQLDAIFAIATRRGAGIDIHLHDAGLLGLHQLEEIAARTRALGLGGKVAVSHAFALGMVDAPVASRTADVLARAGVSIMTHAPGGFSMPPVKLLREHGVVVFSGSDNIRDAWSPFGNGDMLERAMLVAYRQGFRRDDDLAAALDLATGSAARALGLARYGLEPGCDADLVAVMAGGLPEAVVMRPQRKLVIKRGRIVARDGAMVAAPS